jgi:hypothetical protein
MPHLTTSRVAPRPEEIARLAYRLWQDAGRPPGRYIEFWNKVEQWLQEGRDTEPRCEENFGPVQPGASSPEDTGRGVPAPDEQKARTSRQTNPSAPAVHSVLGEWAV